MESRGKRSKGITKQQLHVRRTVKQGNNFWVHRTSSLNGQMQSHHGLFPHRILRKSTELLLHSKFHRQACSSVRNLVCTSILQSLSSVFCAHNIFWVLSSGNVENFSQEISEIWVGMCCRLCVSCAGVALLAFVIAPTPPCLSAGVMVAKPAIPRRFTSLVLRQTAQKVQRKKLRKKLKTCKPAPREDAESSFSITSSAHEVSAMDSPVVFGFFSDGERCHSSDHLWDDLWNEDGAPFATFSLDFLSLSCLIRCFFG